MAVSAIRADFIPSSAMETSWLAQLRRMRGGVPTFEIMRMIDSFDLQMSIWYEDSIHNQDKNDPLVRNYIKSLEHYLSKGSITMHRENARIDLDLVASELRRGSVVLLNGTVSGVPHMRVCVGIAGNGLVVADPLEDASYIVEQASFSHYFNAPHGKWAVSVEERHLPAKTPAGRGAVCPV